MRLVLSWLLQVALLAAASQLVCVHAQTMMGPLLINEFMSSAGPASPKAPGAASPSDWVELFNSGSSSVNTQGWILSDSKDASKGWQMPAVEVPPGGLLVVWLSQSGAPANAPAGTLFADIAISKAGEALYLFGPDGQVASSTGDVPQQLEGVTYGLPPSVSTYNYLANPTPGAANSAARTGDAPVITSLERTPRGAVPAGQDTVVTAQVRPAAAGAGVGAVTLVYRVNYDPEQTLPMTAAGAADASGVTAYRATIPAAATKEGDLLRWAVQAADTSGTTTSRYPPLQQGKEPTYEGRVVPLAAAASSPIPVLYWYTPDPTAAMSQAGGISTLSYNGTLYDGVNSSRRGVTSLTWKKPKMSFDANSNNFEWLPDAPKEGELKLNSLFYELGENSYMKEVVAYQVMSEVGVIAPLSYHAQVVLNGAFGGLYEVVGNVDTGLLERVGLPTDGPIFKSVSGELSNLRWDLPISEMPFYYGKANRKDVASDWRLLAAFTAGLAGKGPVPRSKFVFDYLNLPAVINEMAVNTLLGNMDRCTKNFYVYRNPVTEEWIRIPWDVEASFGQDNNLGGAPGPAYCILACEQWNSPLYCDSEHPQDIAGIQTPWGTITAVGGNTYQGAARGAAATGRRLAMCPKQHAARRLQQGGQILAEGNKPLTWPQPMGWANPDAMASNRTSIQGAAGTYNHLTDAILDVAATREMYLRRLRTLADTYYGGGRLKQIIDDHYNRIKGVATADNAKWGGGDITRGYTQLTTEYIPIRSKQLLQTYAPGGVRPLLPGPQDVSAVRLALGRSDTSSAAQQFVEVLNLTPTAVDVSGWQVNGGGVSWGLPAGTVISTNGSVTLVPDVKAFRTRPVSPTGGEGLLVIQAPAQLVAGAAGLSITAGDGTKVL